MKPILVLLVVFSLAACQREKGPQDISGTGTVEAIEVTIGNKIPGQVLEVIPREGKLVNVGDVVARIDHDDLDLELERARAGVRAAEAQLTLLRRGPRMASRLVRPPPKAARRAAATGRPAADADRAQRRAGRTAPAGRVPTGPLATGATADPGPARRASSSPRPRRCATSASPTPWAGRKSDGPTTTATPSRTSGRKMLSKTNRPTPRRPKAKRATSRTSLDGARGTT